MNAITEKKMLYRPKRILITGGAGFIGSHYVLYHLKHYPECTIVNLDKLTYAASLGNLKTVTSPAYHFVQGDIGDKLLIEKLLKEFEIDTIVHFAAESHVDRSIAGPEIFVQTNVVGSFVLLETARKVWLEQNKWDATSCRFHHISTDEVYGTLKPRDPAFTETTPYAPNSPYSASKAGSDHLVRAYFHTYHLPITVSNCSNNYGPHQHQEKFIPTVIRSCLAAKPIPLYGDGSNIRDWLYVEDHCSAIDLIIRQSQIGEIYNVGGNAECSNLEMVELICDVLAEKMNKPIETYRKLISFVTDRPGHDFRYAINCTKLEKNLGWKRQFQLAEGIRKTVEWFAKLVSTRRINSLS